MDDFYAARDCTTPPLPWPSIAPPITLGKAQKAGANVTISIAETANDPMPYTA